MFSFYIYTLILFLILSQTIGFSLPNHNEKFARLKRQWDFQDGDDENVQVDESEVNTDDEASDVQQQGVYDQGGVLEQEVINDDQFGGFQQISEEFQQNQQGLQLNQQNQDGFQQNEHQGFGRNQEQSFGQNQQGFQQNQQSFQQNQQNQDGFQQNQQGFGRNQEQSFGQNQPQHFDENQQGFQQNQQGFQQNQHSLQLNQQNQDGFRQNQQQGVGQNQDQSFGQNQPQLFDQNQQGFQQNQQSLQRNQQNQDGFQQNQQQGFGQNQDQSFGQNQPQLFDKNQQGFQQNQQNQDGFQQNQQGFGQNQQGFGQNQDQSFGQNQPELFDKNQQGFQQNQQGFQRIQQYEDGFQQNPQQRFGQNQDQSFGQNQPQYFDKNQQGFQQNQQSFQRNQQNSQQRFGQNQPQQFAPPPPPLPPTPAPPRPLPTVATTSVPQFTRCLWNCPATSQYNPVCGTDRISYSNEGRLNCAKNCGQILSIVYVTHATVEGEGWSWGGDAEKPSPSTPKPTSPPTDGTKRPTPPNGTSRYDNCIKQCPKMPQYNPVCGSDNKTYKNDGMLKCARNCGTDVETKNLGKCPENPPPTTPKPNLRYESCLNDCPKLTQYNPLCGTDGTTYNNDQLLSCAKNCGKSVKFDFRGKCADIPPQPDDSSIVPPPTNKPKPKPPPSDLDETIFRQCLNDCASTLEFEPVCGNNGVTYANRALFNCQVKCGRKIEVISIGKCPSEANATSKPNARMDGCIKKCPILPQYNPICGTNSRTYKNEGMLKCAQNCGLDVKVSYLGACPRP